MAWSLNMTGTFDGEEGPEREKRFLSRLNRLAKDWGISSGRFYGDYMGEHDLEPVEEKDE